MVNKKLGKAEFKPSVPSKAGKADINDIHKSLGFGEVPGDYSARRNDLEFDAELKKELQEKNLVARWINYQKYQKTKFHPSHWVPFKRESTPKNVALFSKNEGYTVFKDLILAVKPVAWNDAHKKHLRDRAQRMSNPQALKTKEFKESLKASGLPAVVKEGYED